MNKYLLFAKHFYNLGLNVTCINNQLTESNFYSPNIVKSACHPWNHLLDHRQELSELLGYNWDSATGLGVISGYENLHVLDIDGCSNEDFLKDILLLLGLPENYEWAVKTGSNNGFHIHFYTYENTHFEKDVMCSSFPVNKENFGLFEKIELLHHTNVVLPNSLHKSGSNYKFLYTKLPKYKPAYIDIFKFEYVIDLFLNRSKMVEKNVGAYYDIRIEREEVKLKQPSNLETADISQYNDMILIFDIETDGLTIENNYPSIVQISWVIMDFDGIIHKKNTELILGEYDFSSDAFRINNIKPLVIKKIGISPEDAYQDLVYDLNYCSLIISHNLDFDLPILKNEFLKNNIHFDFEKMRKFCSMKWGYNNFKVFRNKYPKMIELYKKLFETEIKQYHNADSDVDTLSKIVKHLMINLDIEELSSDY